MPAATFLRSVLSSRAVRRLTDGVALHPYAAHIGKLKRLVEAIRTVTNRRAGRGVPMFITELGWGSQNDPTVVSFEQGIRGQARKVRRAYSYLTRNRKRLRLRAVYWFTWKDMEGACSFCDSAGLLYGGAGFRSKPAWRTFVGFTGGKLRPES
jgi:hypothetical protein